MKIKKIYKKIFGVYSVTDMDNPDKPTEYRDDTCKDLKMLADKINEIVDMINKDKK